MNQNALFSEQIKAKYFKHSISDISGERSMEFSSNLEPFLFEVSDTEKIEDEEYMKMDWNKCETDVVCLRKLSEIVACHDPVKLNGDIENGLTETICNHFIDTAGIPSVNKQCHDSVEFKSIEIIDTRKESEGSDNVTTKLERKRKRESIGATYMLNWIYKVAQNPCDPAIESLPEISEWRKHATNDNIWMQIILIREARLLRRNDQQLGLQKGPRMHPAMYEEPDKLRYSQRIHSAKDPLKKSRAQSILESSSRGIQKDKDESLETNIELMPDYLANKSSRQMSVYIGPEYQADVDEWTEKTYEADSKWSGTRIWPLERVEYNKSLIEREPLGKGRSDSCGCQFSGSTECVKFHVSEKRKRLKLELGTAYFLWRFSRMGEETSISWTKEEVNKFHVAWKLNPLSFLDECLKALPNKSRASLVSYYFNVFLIRRRGDQNRTTPNNINSDDDDDDESVTKSENVKPLDSILHSPTKAQLKKNPDRT